MVLTLILILTFTFVETFNDFHIEPREHFEETFSEGFQENHVDNEVH